MITPGHLTERSLAAQGSDLIAGFDEVGQWRLAGPVDDRVRRHLDGALGPLDADDAVELSGGPTWRACRTAWPDSKCSPEHRRARRFSTNCAENWCAASPY